MVDLPIIGHVIGHNRQPIVTIRPPLQQAAEQFARARQPVDEARSKPQPQPWPVMASAGEAAASEPRSGSAVSAVVTTVLMDYETRKQPEQTAGPGFVA
jgi:hypothetical protein